MADQRLLTTVVGSYPQPDWLIDRQVLPVSVTGVCGGFPKSF